MPRAPGAVVVAGAADAAAAWRRRAAAHALHAASLRRAAGTCRLVPPGCIPGCTLLRLRCAFYIGAMYVQQASAEGMEMEARGRCSGPNVYFLFVDSAVLGLRS